jgi:hypothetical protein
MSKDLTAKKDTRSRKQAHAEKVLTYGEIHLHISVAIDSLRARWPADTEDMLLHRMVITARRILENRRNGVPVIMRRNDLTE